MAERGAMPPCVCRGDMQVTYRCWWLGLGGEEGLQWRILQADIVHVLGVHG